MEPRQSTFSVTLNFKAVHTDRVCCTPTFAQTSLWCQWSGDALIASGVEKLWLVRYGFHSGNFGRLMYVCAPYLPLEMSKVFN